MGNNFYKQIISLVLRASKIAKKIGIDNLLQPGLVKEMIIADILGHELITSKRDADAHATGNPSVKYEYLSCKEGGSGQLDRMFREPARKRKESLSRITRNEKIYYAVFYSDDQTKVKVIYEIEPRVLLKETERRLNGSRNEISHVGFSESWVKANSRIVYKN